MSEGVRRDGIVDTSPNYIEPNAKERGVGGVGGGERRRGSKRERPRSGLAGSGGACMGQFDVRYLT
mgnify:CR=1 FL=1